MTTTLARRSRPVNCGLHLLLNQIELTHHASPPFSLFLCDFDQIVTVWIDVPQRPQFVWSQLHLMHAEDVGLEPTTAGAAPP